MDVRGARQHNLRNISVSIPRNTLTVVTGLSGSGKSSLAFDTIYAEGQRRYVETLSAYARQFLDQMERPDVDSIDGLSPAISIEQKTTSRSPRSTVGTITEIYDYLRLLYASVGQPHCPNCHRPISRQSPEQIVAQIVERSLAESPGERITVMAPIVRGRKGEFRDEIEALDKKGYRLRIDSEIVEVEEGMRLEKRKNHTIEAIVDRVILKPAAAEERAPSPNPSAGQPTTQPHYDTRRLLSAVTTALQLANGLVLIALSSPRGKPNPAAETLFSSSMACPECGINVPRLEPRSFSFNSSYGACPECNGLGSIYDFDPAKVITDWSKPLLDGAMGPGSSSQYLQRLIRLAAQKYKINLSQPFSALPREQQQLLLDGPPRNEIARTGFHGILNWLRDSLEDTRSEGYREYMLQFMSATECTSCLGRRLRPESLAVTLPLAAQSPASTNQPGQNAASQPLLNSGAHTTTIDVSIADFTALPIDRALTAARSLRLTGRDLLIADRLRQEILDRLEFLHAVGLGYLSLDRSAATLSGGEGQRIRLATQIGSRLRGVLYILDEPSIGLHQRDNQRLIAALQALRDLGNTVIVVEHDEDTMRQADFLLDLGPGAGKNGGQVIASGTPEQVMANPASITGQYLAGHISLLARPTPNAAPRPLTGRWISIEDATAHNLQHLTAHFPLGVFTVVTGVSGSGKSTLVNDILYRALARELYGSREQPGAHKAIYGADQIDKVIGIDQSPIGRTPRSNPATYTGVFTAIRDLFAMLPESRERGYKPGRFSFNVQGGRCEACQGEGQRRIEMNFLPDVYVLCEVCNGRRYNQETLGVKFNGYSIADILELPIEDALPVLKDIPAVYQKLQTLVEVGLGYIHLGQSATTLSGGEAQRMKLARELSKRQTGRTLYLLDEPTTGLHFDDVRKLLEVLHRLTDLGNSVIVIEHNLDIIRNADYLIDMGPEGGEAGGRIVAQGPPEVVAGAPGSHTGFFLARYCRPGNPQHGASATQIPPFNLPDLSGPDQQLRALKRKNPRSTARKKPEKKTGVPSRSPSLPAPVKTRASRPSTQPSRPPAARTAAQTSTRSVANSKITKTPARRAK
ncbi:MAG: excinuclease ABC subunit UvrA [Acidobacteriaceae bacterium]